MRFLDKKKLAFAGLVVAALSFNLTTTGCLTDSKKDDTTKTPVVADSIMTKTIVLGAQSNAAASSLDLDTWTAYTATAGAAHSSDIDVIFAYSTSANIAALYSPNIAKNGIAGASGGFDFMSTWTNANTTLMRSIATADTTKLKGQSDIKALYDAGSDPTPVGRIQASAGSFVVAKSNLGLYTLLKVTAVVAAADGTVNLIGWAKW